MKRAARAVSSLLLIVIASCGGGGGGANADTFSGDLDDVCRPIKNDLGDLAIPVSLADIGATANKASRLIEEGLADMRKLDIPTANKTFENDANDLLDTFDSQITALDDIAAAAASADDVSAQDGIRKFDKLVDQAADIADDLDASRCKFDSPFTAELVPVDTVPVDTVPPAISVPADTVAPGTDNKVEEDLVSQLVPAGDYTFVTTDASLLQTFRDVLAATPTLNAQPGTIGSVDIVSGGVSFARLFVFAPDGTLIDGSVAELATFIAAGQPTSLASFSVVAGARWVTADAIEMFVGSIGDVVIWAVATNGVDLEAGVVDLIDSIT